MTKDELIDAYAKAGAAYLDASFGSLYEKAARLAYKHWENQWINIVGDNNYLLTDAVSERIRAYRKFREESY